MKKRRLLTIAVAAAVCVCVAAGVFLSGGYEADERAEAALVSDEAVQVYELEGGLTVFEPLEGTAGFIFYPGGLVEHTAYAPLLRGLAQEGVLCVLAEMPLDLAVLDMNAAEGIPAQFSEIEHWYIGGHSLGGAMAASHAAQQPGVYDGLVLLAAYSTESLEHMNMKVVSLYGTNDEVLDMEKYRQYRDNLPEDAVEHVIEGGCHAWFGSYGPQKGDGVPTITQEEQNRTAIAVISDMILNEE